MEQRSSASAESVVQRQVDAYNARDLDAFIACYHDDIEMRRLPEQILLQGAAAFRERYRRRFADNPSLRADIHQRFCTGDFVVDFETVQGEAFGASAAVVIYQVEGDRIRRTWSVSEGRLDQRKSGPASAASGA